MTIKSFLDSLPNLNNPNNGQTLRESMAEQMPVWNNNSCSGYAILAMREAGYNPEEIRRVLECMSEIFHEYDVEQAEEEYRYFCS